MATDRVLEGLRLTPDDVAEHEFAHGFRGYDVHEVRSFLRIVANEIGRLHEVGETAVETPSIESLSREQLSELVGEESARVLAAAESAAADIRQRAEDNIAQMLREVRTEAAEIRAAADQQRADDIERSESTLSTAHDEAASILAAAEVEAQSIRDRAVEKGREMIAEAH